MATVTLTSDSTSPSGFAVATWTGDGTAQLVDPGFSPRWINLYNLTDGISLVHADGMTSTFLQANGAATTENEVRVYSSTQSPAIVAANTTEEKSMTVTGVTAGSFVMVNKPTQQAGLGVCTARVSAANTVAVVMSNATGAGITPTASQSYNIIEFKPGLATSITISPTQVAANTSNEQIFAVAGVRVGQMVAVNKPTHQAGMAIGNCRVSSDGFIAITFMNMTASPITPTASEAYLVLNLSTVLPNSNLLDYGINVGALAQVNTVTAPEQSVTANGLLAADIVMGVSKPTAQAGLGIAGYRIVSANTIGITFVNPTAGNITPTASEKYSVSIYRSTPGPVVKNFTTSLAPVSVAANTTAEQTFTVTGLVAASSVWISKPTHQTGLQITGVRVSAADTLAITFQNNTSGAIVPTTESYVISNFPDVVVATDGSWVGRPYSIAAPATVQLVADATAITVPAPTTVTGGTGVTGMLIAAGQNVSGKSYKAILFR